MKYRINYNSSSPHNVPRLVHGIHNSIYIAGSRGQAAGRRYLRLAWVVLINLLLSLSNTSQAVSLFNDTLYRPLIADKKAYLLGDPLTVLVIETSNAQSSTDLASRKEIKANVEGSYNNNRYEGGAGLNGKGNMTAKTGRNGKIKATLTVQVKQILSNNMYQVEGQQLIQVNGEQQTIELQGIVRQEDISSQNTVLSTRIADAQITYTGEGSVSNSQRNNIFYRLLSFVGLV